MNIPIGTIIKKSFSIVICRALTLKVFYNIITNCLEKRGYSIMLVKEIESKFNELKEGNQELKQGNRELKQGNRELENKFNELKEGNRELKRDNQELKQSNREINKKLDKVIKKIQGN